MIIRREKRPLDLPEGSVERCVGEMGSVIDALAKMVEKTVKI
jgi:hypothetical protein